MSLTYQPQPSNNPPVDPVESRFRNAMTGVLRKPGRGKRAGQWVNSGGEFNNLTQDEVLGRVMKQGSGNSGSGPGGGLRTGGLGLSGGGESGLDWVKRNGPGRYQQPAASAAALPPANPLSPDSNPAMVAGPPASAVGQSAVSPNAVTPTPAAPAAPPSPLQITSVNGAPGTMNDQPVPAPFARPAMPMPVPPGTDGKMQMPAAKKRLPVRVGQGMERGMPVRIA